MKKSGVEKLMFFGDGSVIEGENGLTSEFMCQEENLENPVFLVATIVVGVIIECFCMYASIQPKHPIIPPPLQGNNLKNGNNKKIIWEPSKELIQLTVYRSFFSDSGVFPLRRLASWQG